MAYPVQKNHLLRIKKNDLANCTKTGQPVLFALSTEIVYNIVTAKETRHGEPGFRSEEDGMNGTGSAGMHLIPEKLKTGGWVVTGTWCGKMVFKQSFSDAESAFAFIYGGRQQVIHRSGRLPET